MKTVKFVCAIIAIAGGFLFLGIIGDYERTDEIIRSMDEKIYNQIQDSLRIHGEYPSDEEVAKFYLENY